MITTPTTTSEHPCDHDWRMVDDSFDHAFGTERVRPYLECNTCGETASIPFPRQREP